MKKIAEKSGSGGGFKPVLSRKKKKSVALKEGVGGKEIPAEVSGDCSWSSETGDTIESESINMKEKCLVEKISFDYSESGTIADKEHDQMPKGPNTTTKMALGKPLRKINFSSLDINDDVLLDAFLELLPLLKNLVSVSVRKSFALDIGLNKVVGKSSQEKLMVVRSLAQDTEKARTADILVNTNLKKSASYSDQTVVVKEIPQSDQTDLVATEWSILIGKDAVYVVRADLNKVLWDKRDHHKALLYTLPMGTNVYDIWDFVQSVGGKTCIIDRHLITYARVRCAVVCFDSAESLDVVMGTTPVLKGSNLHWSSLVSVRCAKCKKLDYISLSCVESGKVFSDGSFHKVLLNSDKSRLAAIYVKHSVLVAHPVKIANGSSFSPFSNWIVLENVGSSSEMKPSLTAVVEINDRFAALKHSLVSLAEHVNILAKRLATSVPIVSQLNPGRQPLVTPLLQNQGLDIVMSESLGVVTSDKTVVKAVIFDNSVIGKIENTLRNLTIMVMGLSAKINNAGMVLIDQPSQ
ncbi:hypothetical protein G9A89_002069 [Geosiphon pyriformis]|nr:hypothetical protein G9A89_002069 [Geosiphon pyriformis]